MATNQTSLPVANDIRDIKPPIEISNGWEWLCWTLGAVVVLVALTLLWRYMHRRMTHISVPPPIPAHIRAKQKLEEALALISQPKPFVIAVSDTARIYLEERFQFRAPERTTEEFLRELAGTNLLAGEQKESLGGFLQSCDLVKFAKYEPGEPELRNLHQSAIQLVDETKSGPVMPAAPPPVPARASKGRLLAIIGAWMQLPPVCSVLAYFVFLIYLFVYAGADLSDPAPKTKELSAALGQMTGLLIGLYIAGILSVLTGLTGLVMLGWALIKLRYRALWLFLFLLIYGLMLLLAFPFGTIIGLFFIIYCFVKIGEFFPSRTKVNASQVP